MANFSYSRYNIKKNWGLGVYDSRIELPQLDEYSGFSAYIITEDGRFQLVGDSNRTIRRYDYGNVEVYSMTQGKLIVSFFDNTAAPPKLVRYFYNSPVVKSTERGAYVGSVTAQEGAYPVNGISGEFWYVRQGLAENANITSPIGTDILNESFTIEWTKTANDVNVDIELSTDNGENWRSIFTNQTGTSVSYNFRNEPDTATARLRIRASKGTEKGNWATTGVFTIKHNYAPGMPTNLTPSSTIIDRTIIQRLSWKHNHTNAQLRFKLEWSTNQTDWTTIEQTTDRQYLDVASDTFPSGTIYWRVTTWSLNNIESPVSNIAIFTAALPSDAPIITSPNTTIYSRPILTWTQGDQVSYQYKIRDSVDTVLFDSGEVISDARAVTMPIDLLNDSIYTIQLRTKTALGLWTPYTEQVLTVSYTEPATPTFDLIEGNGFVAINIDNPIPSELQPDVLYNDVYRDHIRIATKVGDNYKDYTARSGKEYNYQVIAIGENGTISESIYQRFSIRLEWSFLSNLYGDMVELKLNPQRDRSREFYGERLFFAGRTRPVMQFEEFIDDNISLSFKVIEESELEAFKSIADSREILLYRDNRGRKIFGVIRGYSIADDVADTEWYNISFTFSEVYYSEVV